MSNFQVDTWDDDSNNGDSDQFFKLNLLSGSEMKKMQSLFKKYDRRSEGFVETRHCLDMFKLAGQNYSFEMEKLIMDEINESKTGIIMFDDLVRIYRKYSKTSFEQQIELELALKAFVHEKKINKDTGEEEEYINFEQLKEYLLTVGDLLYKQDILAIEKAVFKTNTKKAVKLDSKTGKYIQTATITLKDMTGLLLQHLKEETKPEVVPKQKKKTSKKKTTKT